MAEFDLTSKISPYLDRHLVFPLLEFLAENDIFDATELEKSRLAMLSDTNMVDFAMDIHAALYGHEEDYTPPEHLVQKRMSVVNKLKEITVQTEPIVAMMEQPEVRDQIEKSRDGRDLMNLLTEEHGFRYEMLAIMYENARFQYECGNYSGASHFLYSVRVLAPPGDKYTLNALWGKLASEILLQNWDAALDDLNKVKEVTDSAQYPATLQILQQRTWLIHWSLFVFFNHPKGPDNIIEMFLYDNRYLNAIQTTCPHILRYLTAAVITSSKRRTVLKDLVKIIQQESYTYRDPITQFVECLYVDFDFDKAQGQLRQCEQVLVNDFFLVAMLEDFMENARLFIFETFCQIHECISISMLADKLGMGKEEAERWIVNMIRNARLDAKIDSKQGHVLMGTQAVSTYQQMIDKTKALYFRCNAVTTSMENMENKHSGNKHGENQWGSHD